MTDRQQFRMNDQRSTYDQLRDLVQLANRHGLYDAADFVERAIERGKAKWPCPT